MCEAKRIFVDVMFFFSSCYLFMGADHLHGWSAGWPGGYHTLTKKEKESERLDDDLRP